MPLRSYDPTIARWNRIDRVTHHSLSTYNGFDNNPIYYADPSGGNSFRGGHANRLQRMRDQYYGSEYSNIDGFMGRVNDHSTTFDDNNNRPGVVYQATNYGNNLAAALKDLGVKYDILHTGDLSHNITQKEWDNWDDNITVNKDGIVTNVEKNNQPNRFFDEDGNELFFNDSNEVDQPYATAIFRRGERLFYFVSSEQINNEIINSGIIGQRYLSNVQITGPLFWASSWISAAIKGHSDFDFAEGYLINLSNEKTPSGNGLLSRNRASWADGTAFFRFGNTNNIYNLYDAGNYMWGRAMGISGFKYWEIRFGSRANELFFDSKADQRAIRRGFYNK